jgi:hypothetical protein
MRAELHVMHAAAALPTLCSSDNRRSLNSPLICFAPLDCHHLPQVVENVLAECGQDIDAAIRRLNQLKLSPEQAGAQAQQAAAAAQPAAAAAAAPGHPQQQAAEDQQPTAQAATAAGPQTADQWVDALVQEMAAAKDMGDARSRAGKLLQAFEQFVVAHTAKEVRVAVCDMRWRLLKLLVRCCVVRDHP